MIITSRLESNDRRRKMKDYNILVTFHPNERMKAEQEIEERLKDAEVKLVDMIESSISGVILLMVEGDGEEAIRKVSGLASRFPELFAHLHRWIPIDNWVRADPENMAEAVRTMGKRLNDNASWKLNVQKRNYGGAESTAELISMLAAEIQKGKVDLEEPEMTIFVEVIGDSAGISIAAVGEFLDINEVRQVSGMTKIV